MKKVLALVLALVMVLSLVACGGQTPSDSTNPPVDNGETNPPAGNENPLAGTYDIVIWVAEAAVELTQQQVAKFNETNTDGIVINATVEKVSEADAATQMINDVTAGADLFCFAQDQFVRLNEAGALAKLGAGAAEIVKSGNDAGAVLAATSAGELFAYPLTADNGYFMYYDKSVIPEEHVDSLESLIADCEAAGKYFSMEVQTSAWYIASWFFATGCTSDWTTDADGNFNNVNDTFNSDAGLIAVKGMEKLVKSPNHVSSSQAAEFANGAAVLVTGTWAYNDIQAILGDNMGVADLPSFEVDGTSYHLGSYNGCKLLGVKPQSDAVKQAVLHKLAQYMTSEECQMQRFETLAWGPSNLAAQASDAVKANPGLTALFQQNAYSKPQGQIHGSWWDIAKVIGDEVKAAADEDGLKAALANYEGKIKGLFALSDETLNAWTVIGTVGGTNWDTDLPMTNEGDIWTSEAYEMAAGTEFKVRKGLSWDENWGVEFNGGNVVVETAGTYKIQFNAATGEITLLAQ